MRVPRVVSRVGLVLVILLSLLPISVCAATAQPALRIREVNITGDEFVVLQNVGTAPAHLAEYWLGYGSDDTVAYVVPTQQLPMADLAPGQALLLNNGSASTCDASVVDQLGFSSLSNTKGILQLRHLSNDGNSSTFTTIDSVSWGKLPADAIQIAQESQLADGAKPVWYHDATDSLSPWRVGDLEGCSLTLPASDPDDSTSSPTTIFWTQNNASPPSIYVGSSASNNSNAPFIPKGDKGLKAPQLSEILPNPASPQTDAADEFIEVYNPNSKSFDLSGFMLQSASTTSTTTHTYHFPAGTVIGPGGFKAFRSSQTHLSLSNGGGQVWLLDPFGTTLDTCDPYGTAKDGQSWINANDKWQWTLQPTPNTTNKIATPIAASGSSKTATVNGKKVTAVADRSATSKGSTLGANTTNVSDQPLSIHPLTLTIIIFGAMLYGAYEYRHDLALQYRRFRQNRRLRP